jgi:hypothetical protein
MASLNRSATSQRSPLPYYMLPCPIRLSFQVCPLGCVYFPTINLSGIPTGIREDHALCARSLNLRSMGRADNATAYELNCELHEYDHLQTLRGPLFGKPCKSLSTCPSCVRDAGFSAVSACGSSCEFSCGASKGYPTTRIISARRRISALKFSKNIA